MPTTTVAPYVQRWAKEFFATLGWSAEQTRPNSLLLTKNVAAKELTWGLHFEDDNSFSQMPSPKEFAQALATPSMGYDLFDLIAVENVVSTQRWEEEVAPWLTDQLGRRRNRQWGTWKSFLNRFAGDVARKQQSALAPLYDKHRIKSPLPTYFREGGSAFPACAEWLVEPEGRIMLVLGDPGAGKSVFALSLAQHLGSQFKADPERYPAPFLIWFSIERSAVLEDLISITLQDLKITDLTVDAIKFLLSQGRVVFVIDGFDEISRALAHQAEATTDELSKQINRNTKGRLILTSRPAFLTQEDLFTEFSRACEEERPQSRSIAPYTDVQQRDWVLNSAQDAAPNGPTLPVWRSQHWQRMQTAFDNHPPLRELCRTPVYLRLLSDVIHRDRAIRSRDDLITTFCEEMWERERGKRPLVLSNQQYLMAYEAISAAVVDEQTIKQSEVRTFLELYFEAHAKELLADFPTDADVLLRDLAIGPLTSAVTGQFSFTHQILTGYFYARLLARSLNSLDKRCYELWSKELYPTVWEFLPDAVGLLVVKDKVALVGDVRRSTRSGLMLWNLVGALKSETPKDFYEGKDVVDIVFDSTGPAQARLPNQASFLASNLRKAMFIGCDLAGVSFRDARLGRIKFVECAPGAVFDAELKLADDAEVTLVRQRGGEAETYVGDEIRRVLAVLSAQEKRTQRPGQMGHLATIIILSSLYRVDKRSYDFPERRKMENRVRAWLSGFDLNQAQRRQHLSICMELFEELVGKGWIVRNPARTRTFIANPATDGQVREVVRSGAIPVHFNSLARIADEYDQRLATI
jgi:hypothetical protein